MADIYETLIGGVPTDKAQQSQLAATLRRRRALGELGSLTGDQVLQSFGGNMMRNADATAEQMQNIRQKDIDNTQTAKYQGEQIRHMDESLAETKRNNDMTNESRLLQAMAAMTKADKAGGTKKGFKMTVADRKKLEDTSGLITNADALSGTFEDGFTQQFGKGPQSRLSNTISNMGLGSDKMDKAAQWWSQWGLVYTLPQRNATFGATLTPSEQQAWKDSDITPSMDAKEVRKRMANITAILKRKGGLINREYRALGADPEVMDVYGLPDGPQEGGHGAIAPPAAAAAPAQGALTPEEEAELVALRKKLGR